MGKFDGEIDFNYKDFTQAAQPVSFLGGWADDTIEFKLPDDRVNSPSHYTRGTQEAIDIIEEAIAEAPSNKSAMLQAQVLKYLLRMWHKDNPLEDAKKAQWYLKRLISSL
jgi:hypothetical protein